MDLLKFMENIDHSIERVSIESKMNSAYLEYAMSVIIGRALPDVRDGLKPVHRRILFAMHNLNLAFNRPYMKSARIVGEVIGKYHPHGDLAIYDATVRMAQSFSMRYQLIDGQGNFGSVDGDSPAAMRYTEVRLKKISGLILEHIDKNTVDFVDNYDGELKEPTVCRRSCLFCSSTVLQELPLAWRPTSPRTTFLRLLTVFSI